MCQSLGTMDEIIIISYRGMGILRGGLCGREFINIFVIHFLTI